MSQNQQKIIPLDKNNPDSIYNWIAIKISSPSFRNIIKDFIDDNCSSFIDVEENSFQQGELFNEFNQLIDNLLDDLLVEGGLTQEQFLVASQRGLEDKKYKKYFNQIINLTSDYNLFKAVMTKRNYQLIKRVEEQMDKVQKEKELKKQKEIERRLKIENQKKGNKKSNREIEEEKHRILLNQYLNQEEERDLQKAIQRSLQAEEDKRKISLIEEEEINRAIKESLLESEKAKKKEKEKEEKEKIEKIEKIEKKEIKDVKKKEVFKIEQNNNFNFESKEMPNLKINNNPPPSVNSKNSINVISNNSNFQFHGNAPKQEVKSNQNNVFSPNKGIEFQIESKKNDFGISNSIGGSIYPPAPINAPIQPSVAKKEEEKLKENNSHIEHKLIYEESQKNKIYTNNPSNYNEIKIERKKEEKNINQNENEIPNNNIKKEVKNSFNLFNFNEKEENVVVSKEIKLEKASDIIKNSLKENKLKEENNDNYGLLIDSDDDDKNNFKQNEAKTNTFIDKNKDINLGKVKFGKDGGNYLNNFTTKNYEKDGMKKIENKIKEEKYKSVITNNNEDDDFLKKIKEVENEKQAKLKEYREYLLKIKKEKREEKAKELLSPEEFAKLESKKKLAEQLKAKRK